jgi:ribose/xylose/arabinose/galactoside ABC-type transport system permease subunit
VEGTRLGRDVRAVGGAKVAAISAGVPVTGIIVGVFTLSGALAASSGALLSYSLSAASPSGLADVLVPAVSAVILGGVSLGGGIGGPLGILIGVVILSVLRSGLTAIGVAPYVHGIAAGAILVVVALVDAEEMPRQIFRLRRVFARRR